MSLIALDLDGTLIENKWPDLGDWLPGAKEGVQRLLAAGHTCYVYTARCHHLWPNGDPRTQEQIDREFWRVRLLLDEAGFWSVKVVAKEPYDVLVDDRALTYMPVFGWTSVIYKVAAWLRDESLYYEED